MHLLRRINIGLIPSGLLLSTSVMAQSDGPAGMLEENTVTAQKRVQTLHLME